MSALEEGKVRKGGVNERPTTPRPNPPYGQGGKLESKIPRLSDASIRKFLGRTPKDCLHAPASTADFTWIRFGAVE